MKKIKNAISFLTAFIVFSITVFPLQSQVLTIGSNIHCVISGNTYLVLNNGGIKNNGVFHSGNGTVVFSGAGYTVDTGTSPITYNNLSFSGSGTKVNSNNVSVLGTVTIGGTTKVDADGYGNNKNFILRSTATSMATMARADALGGYIFGNVTVERYIPGRRKYRIITSSVTTSDSSTLGVGQEALSIWGNWQNQDDSITANVGTIITGGSTADGFDRQTHYASLFTYDDVNRRYVGFTSANGKNTKYTPLKAGVAFYMFVYGDRLNTITTSSPNNTVLNEYGTLLTGDQSYTTSSSIPLSNVTNRFTMLGNPFASPINWATLPKTNISNTCWAWDPNLSSTGGYISINTSGTVTLIAPFTGTTGLDQYIQPGQGFFVKTTAPSPTLTIREQDKVSNFNANAFRPMNELSLLAVNLMYNNGGKKVLADGVLVAYDPSFADSLDDNDAVKIFGNAETIAIQNGSTMLSIEARNSYTILDTVVLSMAKITKPQYSLQIFSKKMSNYNLIPHLVDNYLETTSPLSVIDTNNITFNINPGIPASFAANRFSIVYRSASVLPLGFTSVKAYRQNNSTYVEWTTENEINMLSYDIERSADGIIFYKVGTQKALNSATTNHYKWLDLQPLVNNAYYRIKGIGKQNDIRFSSIVLVKENTEVSGISVFPNPVTNGTVSIQFTGMAKGMYTARLVNTVGQVLLTRRFYNISGSLYQNLVIQTMDPGLYYLQILLPNSQTSSIKLVIK